MRRRPVAPEIRIPLLLACGVLGAMAFPSVDWSGLAWIWLAPVLGCALNQTPRHALVDGWLAGTVFFLVLLRWLEPTLRFHSSIYWPLTWLPVLALAAYCGLYTGAVTASVAWLRGSLGAGWAFVAVPVLWVAAEWFRAHLLGGFPWGLLGYSQYSQLTIIQVAELTGVYGVSFLVAAANAAIGGAVVLRWRALPGVTATAVILWVSLVFGFVALEAETPRPTSPAQVRIAVIQPSIDQSVKWDTAFREQSLTLLEELSRQAGQSRPSVILWPETAAPSPLREDTRLSERLASLARELGIPLLVGSLDLTTTTPPQLLNSAFLLTGAGVVAKYAKIQLVPFGEYVPVPRLFGFLRNWATFMMDFASGRTRTIFRLPDTAVASVICYEAIFPELFREFVKGGASFMTNISNDAWFGRTSGPWQHLSMLPLRAVENRIAIARATNTGVSALVEPTGRVAQTLPLFTSGILQGSIATRRRTTIYTDFGDWFAYTCLALSLGFLGAGAWARYVRGPARD